MWLLVRSLTPSQITIKNNSPAVQVKVCVLLVCRGKCCVRNDFLSMRSVLLLHLFQIWGGKGHFLRWTHKRSPCCCSRLRSSLSPILNSSLYCMPIMWVLQKCRVSLAWLPSRPKAQLCQVVWYLKEGRILTQARTKKTAQSTLHAFSKKGKSWTGTCCLLFRFLSVSAC